MDKLMIKRSPEAQKFAPPQPKKANDAGLDLPTVRNTIIPQNNKYPVDVPTGIQVKLPKGTWGLVIGRSGATRTTGLTMLPGVIDEDYTGELFACCLNRNAYDVTVLAGERLVQLVVIPLPEMEIALVDELPKTERGVTGFGSTDNE